MEWIQADVYTTTAGIEPVGALLLELGTGGYTIRDAADFEEFLAGKQGHWDLLDDSLLKLREAETALTIYVEDGAQGGEQLTALRQGLARLKEMDKAKEWGRLEVELSGVREQDWANSWKQYYKPTPVGEKLLICPTWEEVKQPEGRSILHMDPGMAFGTGTHESTRLCLELLEGELPLPGAQVLDYGCGSGILGIAALLLGAERASLMDMDAVAVRTAQENAGRNGVEKRCSFAQGTSPQGMEGPFDLIFANIVADVIIALLPDLIGLLAPEGSMILSGIIDTRLGEVEAALQQQGLKAASKREDGGWVAITARR